MLLIYSTKMTNRLRYIFDQIFPLMLGIDWNFTLDKQEFIDFEGPKLNYSSRQFEEELFFYASPLLFERGIKLQKIKMSTFEDIPIFFISNNNSDLPFDPFAASFYLISRYEEYLPSVKDQHNRYPATNSLAYQEGFLQQPVVDKWVLKLQQALAKRYPDIVFRKKDYCFIPSYDIDIAYAYRSKGVLRNLGGYASAIRYGNFKEIARRTRVLFQGEKDPYDTYKWQLNLHKKYDLRPIYFFLVGDYGVYDKNIPLINLEYQELIQIIGDHFDVGIHPSYQSNEKKKILAQEIENLSAVLKKRIDQSRQHYVKLNIPQTYQDLIELDVREDFSMGYPSQLGFRASTASTYYFYDLNLEIKTNLRIFPFMVMDVTMRDYMKLSPEEGLAAVRKIINEVKAVDGLFMTLWHNNGLSDTHGWEGWRDVYEQIVEEAAADK
ncbi:MAG: polysaccharide deacetylase family protein [Chitinophagales bacterium]